MAGEPKQARSATTALLYLTSGALLIVWCVIWYVYLWRHEGSENQYLMCYGFFFSGFVLLGIGLALGRIGRYAKQAEVTAQPNVVAPPPQPMAPAGPVQPNGFVQQPVAAPPAAPVMAAPPVQARRY